MIAAALIAALLAQSPALEQPTPQPAPPPFSMPRFLSPVLGGVALVALGTGVGFKVAEQEAAAALRSPTGGITQRDALATVQRTQLYSQVGYALLMSAAVIGISAIVVAVLTRWAD